ncbi:hypothetical protein [Evansella clarkii]|uniref:hypothetical protein n=1 Tax=Evansella clarkii TaxID=79879 RepID=UPI000997496B|nr:hypothetical protein [Evansella clarkii]
MKYTIAGILLGSFIYQLALQVVAIGAAWLVNNFSPVYVPYWVPAAIIFTLYILILAAWSLFVYGSLKQFDDEREVKRKEREKDREISRENHKAKMKELRSTLRSYK